MGKPKLTKTREKSVYSYVDAKTNKKMYAYRYRYTRTDNKKTDAYKQGFLTLKEAALALTELKAELLADKYTKRDYADVTVDEIFDMFLEYKKDTLKPTSISTINVAKKRISPLIGDMRIKDLTKYNYNKNFVSLIKDTVSVGTIITYHSKLMTVLNFAVDNEMLDKNRLSSVQFKKDVSYEIYTKEEIQRILDYIKERKPHMYEVILFLASTGVRAGEALGLKWRDVDFDLKLVDINCTRDIHGERSPKSKNSYRSLPITEQLYNTLKKYKAAQKAELLQKGVPVKKEDFDDRYVFVTKAGKALNYMAIHRILNQISKEDNFPHCKAHKFRHTYASILMSEYVDVVTVAKLLGDTVETVQRIYVHAVENKLGEAILAFEKSMGNL